jgi:hypothetical protein
MKKKMESMKSQRRKINKKENEFSKVNFPELRKARKYIKKYGEEVFKSEMTNRCNITIEKYNDKSEQFGHLQDMYMVSLLTDVDTNVDNYYINSEELLSFLKNTKIKKEIIPRIITLSDEISIHNQKYEKYFNMDAEITPGNTMFLHKKKDYVGCVHAKNINRSFYFMIQSIAGLNSVAIYALNGDGISYRCNMQKESVLQMNQQENEIIRIVLNMLFYMDAFPDKILDSPPDECVDKLNCNNSKTITMSDEIRDYLHENRDVSPHLRRGHFRYLASDFYKNKKGQTIFVKSSFVKGQAKTIIE